MSKVLEAAQWCLFAELDGIIGNCSPQVPSMCCGQSDLLTAIECPRGMEATCLLCRSTECENLSLAHFWSSDMLSSMAQDSSKEARLRESHVGRSLRVGLGWATSWVAEVTETQGTSPDLTSIPSTPLVTADTSSHTQKQVCSRGKEAVA